MRRMNTSVHLAKMVPTAGLEPAQVAPLAPQTSASTNFATSACITSSLERQAPAAWLPPPTELHVPTHWSARRLDARLDTPASDW